MASAAGGAASAFSASADDKQSIVVAIDFGTSGTGFGVVFRPPGGATAVDDKLVINTFAPGENTEGEKVLTAVLLDKDDKFVAFGVHARELFAQKIDEADKVRKDGQKYFYFEKFKMELAPVDGRPSNLLEATVEAQCTPGGTVRKPLMLPFVRVLEFTLKCVLERLSILHGGAVDRTKIGWLLTLPAIWDDQAKAFMRAAAVKAGLVPSDTSSQLSLVLEPEGAAIASILGSAPEARARMEKLGTKVLVMDCGGGTIDITVSKVVGTNPIQLGEILPPDGGKWGSTYADKNFMDFMEHKLFGVARWARVDHSARVELVKRWEEVKRNYKPETPDENNRVDISQALRCIDDPLATLAEAYNAAHGDRDGRVEVTRRGGSLVLSQKLLESFILPLVRSTIAKVHELLRQEEARDVSFVFLIGGFASSVYMLKETQAAFHSGSRVVIRPERAGLAVVRGAAFFGMYPGSFIASRVSRYSYGVIVSEEYRREVHGDAPTDVARDGARLAVVVRPLVQRGATVAAASCEVDAGLFATSHADDRVIKVELVRTDMPIPALEGAKKRLCVGDRPGQLPRSAVIGCVEVNVGDLSEDDRLVSLYFRFGRAELVVRARLERVGRDVIAGIKY